MSKLLILDKDGTIINPNSGKFVDAPWHQLPIPYVYEQLTDMKKADWTIAIASNQAGIAAGHKSLDQTFLEFRYCLELFPMIDSAFFCPDFQGLDCWRVWGDCKPDHRILYGNGWTSTGQKLAPFRKPDPGMLQLIQDIYPADQVVFAGDRPEDAQAAAALDIPFHLAHTFWIPF